jgi:hypothetical protein
MKMRRKVGRKRKTNGGLVVNLVKSLTFSLTQEGNVTIQRS